MANFRPIFAVFRGNFDQKGKKKARQTALPGPKRQTAKDKRT
jgi:hypothetical protein